MKRLTVLGAAVLAAALAPGLAVAHGGGMAGDGCHTDRKGKSGVAGEVHWHKAGTAERAGPCVGDERPRAHALERDGYVVVETVREVPVEVRIEVPVPGPDCRSELREWALTANDGGYWGHKDDLVAAGWRLHRCAEQRE